MKGKKNTLKQLNLQEYEAKIQFAVVDVNTGTPAMVGFAMIEVVFSHIALGSCQTLPRLYLKEDIMNCYNGDSSSVSLLSDLVFNHAADLGQEVLADDTVEVAVLW